MRSKLHFTSRGVRWPEGTPPETPARAYPRPLDETLSAQRRCSQNDRQSESSLGLSLAMIVPSCAASGVETPRPEPPPEAAPRPPPLPTLRNTPAMRSPAPSPTPRARAHQARHTTPSFWASSRTQTTTGSEVVLKPCIAENQRPNQVLEKSKDYRIGIRNNGFWYTTKLPESSATKFHSRLSFKNQACGCFIHPALTLLQRHFCLLLCLS